MNEYHFWYSEKLARLRAFEGDELNKCKIVIDGEETEIEYTHCHGSFIERGGVGWKDTVYLGQGKITKIGNKPSMRNMFDPPTVEELYELLRLLEFARTLEEEDKNV